MPAELLTAFNALPASLQTVCVSVAVSTVGKILGVGVDALRPKNPGVIFARACTDWQGKVAADQDALAAAFEEFFADNRTQGELSKAFRGDYADVDFDLLERVRHEAGDWAGCPVQGVDVVRQLTLLFDDLNEWLEEQPEYRQRCQVDLQKTLQALHGPAAEVLNHSLARRRYLKAVIREHRYVKFIGTAELEGPTEIGIRQIYVTPRLVVRRDAGGELGEEPEPISARRLLTSDETPQKVVILGAPGSGKSTLGQWMALSLASDAMEESGSQQDARPPVPVFYRIRHLKEDLAEAGKTSNAPTLWDCLHRRASQLAGLSLPPQFFRKMDKRHGLLVFFDGLDEAASQSQAVGLIPGFADSLEEGSRILITSRPFEYRQHFSPADYRHHDLQEFNDDEIREFIDNWRKSREEDEQEAQRKADLLWSSLDGRSHIRELAGNALLLTMIVRVHFRLGELPDSRVELYEKCVDTLLKHWADAAELGVGPLDRDEKTLFLGRLAYEMQQEQEAKLSEAGAPLQISHSELWKRVRAFLKAEKPGTSVEAVVQRLRARDAILVDYGDGQFGFIHRSFQEYFAAWWMKEELSSEKLNEYEGRPAWRETWVMAVAQLEGRRRRKAIVDLLLRNKAPLAAECVRAGKKVERRLSVLACYLAKYYSERDLDITADDCADACGDHEDTRKVLKSLFDREARDGQSLAAAVELAEELARRGDETAAGQLTGFFGEAGRFGLDSTEKMALVEAGEFIYQENQRINLPSFQIDKYLATNRDYECMVPAHRGERDDYSDSDEQPVIYVSWHEANLFCRWRGSGFRLPTEQEWEKAASWDAAKGEKRIYPWEGEFDSEQCNTSENGINRTTPVGSYPSGVSAYGCHNMAGNVWEWTDSQWALGGGSRVLRGGSWLGGQAYARADSRIGTRQYDRFTHVGFRVACASPITEH